ncbi:MAG: hypothetical protein IKO34_06860 [Bacteroidales bacterium]|nr:hypothetical protein [Bacteroidales bacterium]
MKKTVQNYRIETMLAKMTVIFMLVLAVESARKIFFAKKALVSKKCLIFAVPKLTDSSNG